MDPEKKAPVIEEEVKSQYPTDEDDQDAQIFAELDEEETKNVESIEDDVDPEEEKKPDEEVKLDADTDVKHEPDEEEVKPEEDAKPDEDIKSEAEKIDVEQYAKDNKLSLEAAQDEVDSIEKLKVKYGSDLNQMSKAALYALRMYSRTQQELKQVQAKTQKAFDFENEDHVVWNGKKVTKEQVIDKYKQEFPATYDKFDGDDEAVFEDAKEKMRNRAISLSNKHKENFTVKANEKRIVILNNVPNEDMPFMEEIREIVNNTNDSIVMSEDYDIDATLCMARGAHYHEDKKKYGEEMYKKGLEEAQALGEKGKAPEGSGKTKVKVVGGKSNLSPAQEREAEDMYEDDDIPLATKYAYYAEYLNTQKKAS